MVLYGIVTLFTIWLACLVNNQNRQSPCTRGQFVGFIAMGMIFAVLFLLAALRIEVGNDYGTYVTTCHEIYNNGYVVTEPGYNLSVKILYFLSGKEDYLLMFAFYAFVTLFIFMKAMYEQSKSFTLSFFLFMTLGIYFRTFNTVRYYFVLAITLYALRYVIKKEYGKFILLIILAATFHKSVLVVIPLYWIANRKWKKWQIGLMVAAGIGMYLGQDMIMELALRLYPSYADTIYLESGVGIRANLMGIIRCAAVLLFALPFYKKAIAGKEDNQLYFNLNILGLLMYTCGSFLPLASRFSYYLITPHIFLIPGIITCCDKKTAKRLTAIVAVAALIYFAIFLRSAHEEGLRVLPYKTWLFYEQEWLDATQIF